jgi:pyrimidine 5'-nucleotidase
MHFDTIFFDLDSTLYPEACGLWQAIRERIDLYLRQVMKFDLQAIPEMRHRFFVNHGTTLRGLQMNFDVDPVHYLDFVHDLPLQEYLAPDLELREILLSIPHRRWIFTNSDAPHANRVMDILGIQDCFEGMIDVWEMEPLVKPQVGAYQFALEKVGNPRPENCAFLDDSPRNLAPATDLGFFTVLIGQSEKDPSARRSLVDIHDLPKFVPEFWKNE